jgi:hypothetical protein
MFILQLLMAGLDTIRSTSRRGSPLTTKGDLYGFSTVDARLAGTNGQVLSDSTQATGLRWVSAVGGGNVTTDTLSLNNQIEFGHPV